MKLSKVADACHTCPAESAFAFGKGSQTSVLDPESTPASARRKGKRHQAPKAQPATLPGHASTSNSTIDPAEGLAAAQAQQQSSSAEGNTEDLPWGSPDKLQARLTELEAIHASQAAVAAEQAEQTDAKLKSLQARLPSVGCPLSL